MTQGIDYFHQSFALAQKIGAEDSVAYSLYNLAVSYAQAQEWQQALLHALRSLSICDRLQLPDTQDAIDLIWNLIQATELNVSDIESALGQIAELDGESVAERIAICLTEADSEVMDAS